MPELITAVMESPFTEEQHHRIAAKLKAMSDEWDEIEAETGIRPPEAFDYSFGLLDGKELIFSTLPKDADTLRAKILEAKWQ